MGLNVKRVKREDRITNLPIELRELILSRLPTKYAVATSALSKSWRFSWTKLHNLEFGDEITIFSRSRTQKSVKEFTSVVSRVLQSRDRDQAFLTLHRFCLNFDQAIEGSLVNDWLTNAARRDLQEVNISVHLDVPRILPSLIFCCSTLVVLKIAVLGCSLYDEPEFNLHLLKTLHVDGLKLHSEETISKLFAGCPILEELYLRRCLGKQVRVVKIVAPHLESLIINHLPYDLNQRRVHYRILIQAPKLEFFSIEDQCTEIYIDKMVENLITAEVAFELMEGACLKSQVGGSQSKVINDLLKSLSHVKRLVLAGDTVKAVGLCGGIVLPKFPKVTYLKVNKACDLLADLLESMPNLRTLHVQMNMNTPVKKLDDLWVRKLPSCFIRHLNELKVVNFDGLDNEIQFVEVFLKHATALQKVILPCKSCTSAEDEAALLKKVLYLPRSSPICRVICPTP